MLFLLWSPLCCAQVKFVILLLCFLWLNLAAANVILVTDSFAVANQVINGAVYDVSSMAAARKPALCYITECTVKGRGLAFHGYSSASDPDNRWLFNLTMTKTMVSNATIAVTGYFVQHSVLIISHTAATMLGTTPLFDLQGLSLSASALLLIMDTTVMWDQGGSGGDVVLLGGSAVQSIRESSGLFLYRLHATNAAHVVHHGPPACILHSCFVVDQGSSYAMDSVSCEQCTGELFFNDQPNRHLTLSDDSMMRISNCTSTGGRPFMYGAGESLIRLQRGGNLLLYGITTDGTLLASNSGLIHVTGSTRTSLMHINAASIGVAAAIPGVSGNESHVFAGNITLGNRLLTSFAALDADFIQAFYLLDPYGAIEAVRQFPVGPKTVGSPAAVFCVSSGYAGTSWQQLSGWRRAQCVCATGTHAPYCTQVADPIKHYAGYDPLGARAICTVPNCKTCLATSTKQCAECNAGYTLDKAACVLPVLRADISLRADPPCSVRFCARCKASSRTTCATCKSGYVLAAAGKRCDAAPCSETFPRRAERA